MDSYSSFHQTPMWEQDLSHTLGIVLSYNYATWAKECQCCI